MDLLDKYHEKAYDLRKPVTCIIELLTQCNLKCKHCYIPEDSRFYLEKEIVFEILEQLREIGVFTVYFTGGEIFLREDLIEIIAYARKLYMRVILMSNITLLSEEMVKKIADMNVSEFSISLYSMDAKVHDNITQKEGSWKKTMESLEMIKSYKIPIRIKTPLMKDNAYAYKKLHQFCLEENFAFLSSPVIFAKSDGNVETHKLRIDANDLRVIIKDLDEIIERDENRNKPEACPKLRYSFSIDAKGDVFPCNSLYMCVGNVKRQKLKEIWDNSELPYKIQNIKKSDLDRCKQCVVREKCDRCPGLALLEDKDLYGCSTVAREIAYARKA